MFIIDWLRSKLCREPQIDPPSGLEEINIFEISTIVQAAAPNAQHFISDLNYRTTTKTELMRFLKADITDAWGYIPELFDCDDFSFALMGHISNPDWGALAFGILWTQTPTGGHAVNCFIDKNRKFWVIEPQNDNVFEMPVDWDPWLVVM